MYFDGHVHDRGGKEAYKGEDEVHILRVAEIAGVDGILPMPNTNPPITTRELVEEKLERAAKANSKVFYGLHFGLTSDPAQLKEFVKVYNEIPEVVGGKLYMGHSVGDLAVTQIDKQRVVLRVLAGQSYKGVVTIHGGKESLLRPELWISNSPISHCRARPPEAELASYHDAIQLAIEEHFAGWIHFTHVSIPEAVAYIDSIKRNLIGTEHCSLKGVSCDVTPHHLWANSEMMNRSGGIELKVNPPLREEELQKQMPVRLKEGKIDFIATDNALHHYKEKTGQMLDAKGKPIFMSGLPGIHLWPRIAKRLRTEGFSEEQISRLTFDNAVRIFGLEKLVKKSDNKGDVNLHPYSYGEGFYL